MIKNLFLTFFIFSGSLLYSQEQVSDRYIPFRFLVECAEDFDLEKWSTNLKNANQIKTVRPIFKQLNYWLVEYNPTKSISSRDRIQELNSVKGIINTYQDIYTESRLTPNDPRLNEQFPIDLIEVEKVWDVTTGGTTIHGDEIVVGIIDDGYDVNHEDLMENTWVNKGEVSNNEIDDDGNGYIDDYFGLHVPSQTDDHLNITHGIAVQSLLGAKGNNGVGISGINWDVKSMLVSISNNTSGGGSALSVIEGYNYILEQRIKYNETNGTEGAFVVVINYSGGVSEAFPSTIPTWCPIYDELGKAGILNIGATANDDVNVEAVGDMPTLCDSEFLITTTNTDIADRKISSAAYGNISVDLGAPGEDALAAAKNNSYAPFSGTSSSAPHIAGVVALLYSLPCTNLITLAKENPEAATLEVKRAILSGVDALPDLDGITVTGGRLNAYNSYLELDKIAPEILNCPEDAIISEGDSSLVWNDIEVNDDCGGYLLNSSIDSGSEFRFGTTEVVISVTDLIGNSSSCSFEVTREGDSELETAFLDINLIDYSFENSDLIIEYETGSFEVHFLDIYNMLGQLMYTTQTDQISPGTNRFTLQKNQLPSASYFAVVSKAGGGIRDSEKFTIVH